MDGGVSGLVCNEGSMYWDRCFSRPRACAFIEKSLNDNCLWQFCSASSDINHRGDSLLGYLSATNLEIINSGVVSTFITAARREVIDLTLATSSVRQGIKNWQESRDAFLSGYCYVRFRVSTIVLGDGLLVVLPLIC